MQSVASLMSIGKTDIGNLDELEEEEQNMSGNPGKSFTSQISQITEELSKLDCDNYGNPFGDPDDSNPFGDPDLLECQDFTSAWLGILLCSFLVQVCFDLFSKFTNPTSFVFIGSFVN